MATEDRSKPSPESPRSLGGVDERRMSAWIGTPLSVQGKVISTQHLTIDGKVEGTIELGNHGLTIGSGAEIKADLVQVPGRVRFQNNICGTGKATDGVASRVGCNVRDGTALVCVE